MYCTEQLYIPLNETLVSAKLLSYGQKLSVKPQLLELADLRSRRLQHQLFSLDGYWWRG